MGFFGMYTILLRIKIRSMLGTAIIMGRLVGYRNIRDHSNLTTPHFAIIETMKGYIM